MEIWEEFWETLSATERKSFDSTCRCVSCQRIRDKYDKFVIEYLAKSKAEEVKGE